VALGNESYGNKEIFEAICSSSRFPVIILRENRGKAWEYVCFREACEILLVEEKASDGWT